MSGKPRTLTRIINTYNVARSLLDKAYDSSSNPNVVEESSIKLKKKLMKTIILCEQWPYRMSWLLQVAEDCWQEELSPTSPNLPTFSYRSCFSYLFYLFYLLSFLPLLPLLPLLPFLPH